MRNHWHVALLWVWALWSVGATLEFFSGYHVGLLGLGAGAVAAIWLLLGRGSPLHGRPALDRATIAQATTEPES